MKIPRTLALAATAAVATPVVLLSVTPAFADAGPAATHQVRQAEQGKPSIEELEQAATEAQQAYDDALAAKEAAYKVVETVLDSDDTPLAIAAEKAEKAADEAGTAKDAADKALADAKDALAALPETATDEEKAAAQKAVADATAAATAAADAKTAADTKAAAAVDARNDERVAAARAYSVAEAALEKALAAKEAADKALADARNDAEPSPPNCVPEDHLDTVVIGLPSKIVAGSTTDFTFRVTNGTGKKLDAFVPHVYFHATDKSGYNVIDDDFHLQWSTAASPGWKNVGKTGDAGALALKAGARADVKLRLKVDASAPAGEGMAFVAGAYVNDDESCGSNWETEYRFQLLAARTASHDTDGTKPGNTTTHTKPADNTKNTTAQGGKSATPLDAGNPTVTGSLASTGSSSALPKLAAAAGAALALGAAALVAARRRRARATS